jgi:hypothetical protein
MDCWAAGLTGTLPRSLFLLPDLEELNVELNDLGGSLPQDLCKNGNVSGVLRVLSLKNNRFSGPATSLLQCSNLTFLELSVSGIGGASLRAFILVAAAH